MKSKTLQVFHDSSGRISRAEMLATLESVRDAHITIVEEEKDIPKGEVFALVRRPLPGTHIIIIGDGES